MRFRRCSFPTRPEPTPTIEGPRRQDATPRPIRNQTTDKRRTENAVSIVDTPKVVTPGGPRLVITLGVESRPSVYTDALNESEVKRLDDWIRNNAALSALLGQALELATREP